MSTSAEAYRAYLESIEDERKAIEAMYAADDAVPFNQDAFDAANQVHAAALVAKKAAYHEWYAALGREHNAQAVAQ